jgi:hypothetical protein
MLRRSMLARISTFLVLLGWLGLRPDPASAAWTVVFRDDGRAQWQQLFKLVGPPCNVITRIGASLRVKSCPTTTAGNQTAMIWPKRSVAGGIKAEFDFTQLTAVPVPGGSMSGLMLLASGDGSAGYPTDVTAWGAQCCATPLTAIGYAHHMRGLQLNFAYRNDPRGNSTIRLRGLKGAAGDYEELGESAALFPFTNGRAYHITAVRAGSRLTVTARDTVNGTTRSFTITHPYIGALGSGWIGVRQMQARESKFANFKVSTGS